MLNKIKALALLIAVLAMSVVPALAQDETPAGNTVVDVAVEIEVFSTLEAAVIAAGLADTLADPEAEFTVFAPTDGAFNTLLRDLNLTAEQLLANEELLTTVLLYHVLPGKYELTVDGEQVNIPLPVPSLQGEEIALGNDPSGRIGINGGQATIIATNFPASNGVIHIIDNVILPPSVVASLSN